jgi:hypothetical protein
LLGAVFKQPPTTVKQFHDLWVSKIQNLSEWWLLPAIVTDIVAEMIALGLGNVREQALCWKAGALLGERMRSRPASTSLQAARRS